MLNTFYNYVLLNKVKRVVEELESTGDINVYLKYVIRGSYEDNVELFNSKAVYDCFGNISTDVEVNAKES